MTKKIWDLPAAAAIARGKMRAASAAASPHLVEGDRRPPWWSGPALFTAAASGYHRAGAVGARSCGRPQVRSPGGSRAPRRRCAAPPSDRECAARLASPLAQTVGWFGWPSVGRAGPSAPLLLSPAGCRPRLLAAARPARSPAGAEGTGTAHRLGISAHGFPWPLLAPAACSALACFVRAGIGLP